MNNEVQRTEEWFKRRLGKVTASKVSDVMAKTKSGYSASRANYMTQLLLERLTGEREEGYQNVAMLRGIELEPIARSVFEMQTGITVLEAEFKDHPNGMMIGASTDGIASHGGLIEIKCCNAAAHLDFILNRTIPKGYDLQMRLQMACYDKPHCHFVMYHDRFPEHLQLITQRVNRHLLLEKEMMEEVELFLGELDGLLIKLQEQQ